MSVEISFPPVETTPIVDLIVWYTREARRASELRAGAERSTRIEQLVTFKTAMNARIRHEREEERKAGVM
ncbi:hypothetical protein SD70_13690 [Gordoniibacillus kamchatkensis]|uniref:Uncharacterized protein n=1 Tax=Gordoniibacillus kamchatkensis TaxID=1590651 RepID=A0ABR5AHE8_9BACL|nr:hypothetical protein SD70_13690 [Paenibacillus sp. VKM B-2647]